MKRPVFTVIVPNTMEKKQNRESWGWWQGCLTRNPYSVPQARAENKHFQSPDCPQWSRQQSVNGLLWLRKCTWVWWAGPAKELGLPDQCSRAGAEPGARLAPQQGCPMCPKQWAQCHGFLVQTQELLAR